MRGPAAADHPRTVSAEVTDARPRTQNSGQVVRLAGPPGGVPSCTCNSIRGFDLHGELPE